MLRNTLRSVILTPRMTMKDMKMIEETTREDLVAIAKSPPIHVDWRALFTNLTPKNIPSTMKMVHYTGSALGLDLQKSLMSSTAINCSLSVCYEADKLTGSIFGGFISHYSVIGVG